MTENIRTLLTVIFSLLLIIGLPIIIAWWYGYLPDYFRILVGICGAVAVVKFFVLLEPSLLDLVGAFAGLVIILFAYFASPRKY